MQTSGGISIGEQLTKTGGRPTGFDYLRIGLACAILITHSVPTSYGNDVANAFYWLPGVHAVSMLLLPMFFSLSGFLVAGSLQRSRSTVGFLGLRIIRIYPALAVEVLLSALILGPLFTRLPLSDYFSDPVFWTYVRNVTGDVSFELPGVFQNNPVPMLVNRQLWTIPYELYCYMILAVVSLTALFRRRRAFLCVVLASHILVAALLLISAPELIFVGKYARHVQGIELVFSFLAGVLVFAYRDVLPWSRKKLLIAGALCLVLFSVSPGEYLGIFASAYFVAGLGVLNPPKAAFMRAADYSYGVFLYGWPIQQALVAKADWARNAFVNTALALVFSFAMAALSWHFVEKPALKLREPLKRIEDSWLAFRSSFSSALAQLLSVFSGRVIAD